MARLDGPQRAFCSRSAGGEAATPPPPPPPPPPAKRFRVTADALRLRDQPALSSNTLTSLSLDAVVTEVDDNKVTTDGIEWHHVRADDGTVGWMARQYLERVS